MLSDLIREKRENEKKTLVYFKQISVNTESVSCIVCGLLGTEMTLLMKWAFILSLTRVNSEILLDLQSLYSIFFFFLSKAVQC